MDGSSKFLDLEDQENFKTYKNSSYVLNAITNIDVKFIIYIILKREPLYEQMVVLKIL